MGCRADAGVQLYPLMAIGTMALLERSQPKIVIDGVIRHVADDAVGHTSGGRKHKRMDEAVFDTENRIVRDIGVAFHEEHRCQPMESGRIDPDMHMRWPHIASPGDSHHHPYRPIVGNWIRYGENRPKAESAFLIRLQ